MEIFKSFASKYEISTLGNIKSFKGKKPRILKPSPDNLTGRVLAKMFGVGAMTISRIQRGERYKNAGGITRKSKKERLSEDVRNEIKRLYRKGVVGCGSHTLAKKFACSHSTISNIINE